MDETIIQNMIAQLGQSQGERMPAALDVHYADIDERTSRDLLLFSKKLAPFVNYYRNNTSTVAGDWSAFFPFDENTVDALLQNTDGTTTPHLALLIAFLKLYRQPQTLLNQITGRHLDFYFRDVLRLQNNAPVPDRAHVVLELKKNAAPIAITPEHTFSGGKDSSGVELIYRPLAETVINHGSVAALRSIYVDNSGFGSVRYAPVANSSDGSGGALNSDEPKWLGFGAANLPAAEVGFALAAPVLRMQEGQRTVRVALTLDGIDSAKINNSSLAQAFQVFITGEKTWLGPYAIAPTIAGNVLSFDFTIAATEKAVVDYNAAVHGYAYAANAPVLQIQLLATAPQIGYNSFNNVTIKSARVRVDVANITSLTLDSDGGTLDPKKAFLPFGPQAVAGARFHIGCAEALAKKLSELSVTLQWQNAPANFATWYSGYATSVSNTYFTATAQFRDGGNWSTTAYGTALFESGNASGDHTLTFTQGVSNSAASINIGEQVYALAKSHTAWAERSLEGFLLRSPVYSAYRANAPEIASGFITLTLEKNFLHSEYRTQYVSSVVNFSKNGGTFAPPNEPYTPTLHGIKLGYKAYSDDVAISSTQLADFANSDVQFFHIGYFGQMREHGYQRAQFDFIADNNVPLLPAYTHTGELLIGISGLNAGDSTSLLFQVAEGSANPDRSAATIDWAVLCDNYWKPLSTRAVVRDTTNHLLASGIIQFVIPAEATTTNTLLPSDYIWLRAGIKQEVDAVCELIEIAANALEVQFVDQGNAVDHLTAALPAKSITQLKNGIAAVKTVKQPYASFNGSPAENANAFYTRVSERLRHKDRCISAWDYERIVLQAFPRVHKVKCIPHAKENQWLAPGHTLLVVVPDLRNRNAIDPLQPKVDADTIEKIKNYLQQRAGMQVQFAVKNPSYQKIQLDFKVQFRTGYEFNYYSGVLNQALIDALSPWASGSGDLQFGGKIFKSVMLDFVEDLPYVDYVTDFKMYSYRAEQIDRTDLNAALAATPDAILVSEYNHLIAAVDS